MSWVDTNGEVINQQCNYHMAQSRVRDTITCVTLNTISDVVPPSLIGIISVVTDGPVRFQIIKASQN